MPHYSFLDGPYRLAMGLHALDPGEWLEAGADAEQQMAERRRLLAERPGEVVAALPESEAAQHELFALVWDHLPQHFPDRWQRGGAALVDRASGERIPRCPPEPLATLGRMVQEDFCLMQASAAGYRLTGAILCFPAHWRLADKLGRPLDAIHEPVPGFEARLARPVDRFFASLQVERPVWRVNWSLVDTPELFRPPELRRRPRTTDAARAGEQLWLRVERQTLRRLPACGDVVFGIRTYVEPLADVTADPKVGQALAERVREMPADMAAYKGIASIRAPLLAYLERRAPRSGRPRRSALLEYRWCERPNSGNIQTGVIETSIVVASGVTPMPIQPAQCDYRTWIIDSRRWQHYRPRPTDIVIATYPKCGTTWMQRIVDLLIFQTLEPRPVMEISPWIDRRFPEPIETVLARIEAQDHRRFVKSHLPFDGLPIYDEVKYIHVGRDGRDACLSFHNHVLGFTPQALDELDRTGLGDDTIGRAYPRIGVDPAQYFHRWLKEGAVRGHQDGLPAMSFFHFEQSWWDQQHHSNVLLVHYNDLKADLSGEMRRVADFLDIPVAPDIWPRLVEAAGFEAMRRDGAALMGNRATMFQGGSSRFFHKGTNERWRGVFRDEDLLLYEAKAAASLSPACLNWIASGRRQADDASLAQGSEALETGAISVS